ncbi:hypothetical protein pEaSNUABM25_00242 [Erwinia phage pEa_SNUABM_25]|nr:hypothetical protein pEaSNUABM25_00242 [Erwinia phage pEa_SNUABM_25]
MEMLVSLSHELRVDEQDARTAEEAQPQQNPDQARALELQEKKRIEDTYGVEATDEEIKRGEDAETEKKQAEEESAKPEKVENLGQFKPREDLTASQIQDEHDKPINL